MDTSISLYLKVQVALLVIFGNGLEVDLSSGGSFDNLGSVSLTLAPFSGQQSYRDAESQARFFGGCHNQPLIFKTSSPILLHLAHRRAGTTHQIVHHQKRPRQQPIPL